MPQVRKLAVHCAPHGVFEIVQLSAGNSGITIARVEVEKAGVPALKVSRLDPRERSLNTWAMAAVEKAVLENWRDENPTDCKLTAAAKADGIEIVLSGHCGYRLFWWRAEFQILNDEVVVRGPFLSNDPDS